MKRFKLINKTPQPIILYDGAIIFPKGTLIVNENRIDEQIRYFEKLGLISIKIVK